MSMDPTTLLMLTAIIAATVGLLLLFAFAQNRAHRALAVWGAADLIAAVGLAFLLTRNQASDLVSVLLANAVLLVAYAGIWTGARTFFGRPARPLLIVAGPAIWLLACADPQFFGSPGARIILVSAISAAYTLAAAREICIDRSEHLLSRYPMAGWLIIHAGLHIMRIFASLAWQVPSSGDVLRTRWVAVLAFESIIHIIAFGFLQLSMAKERSELVQRRAAETDELTGVTSRRAFLVEAERRLETSLRRSFPAALLLFDLDHFKGINDSFGHEMGDRVLRAFAERAVEALRPGDLFGRIGGEEFAALLVNTSAASAISIAERFRELVERLELKERGELLRLSVSVGVATTAGSSCVLGDLLRQADHALYGAKSAGRNCVRQHRLRALPLLRAV